MLDFLMPSYRSGAKGVIEVYPKFIVGNHTDLMIRGRDFYAVWIAEKSLWSTDEQDLINLVDHIVDEYAEKNKDRFGNYRVLHMWDSESGMIDAWHKYCQKQCRDSFQQLDENLIFSNAPTKKEDYASKRLPYPLESGDITAYKKLVGTLYSEEELHKLEWAIGSIVSGDSKTLQKFVVLYGSAGTGKSTILNIIQMLFEGYCGTFDAKALGSSNNSFALEAFKSNPLVAIQHDGDLSKIEDNTRLNSLVSHELMQVNEKFKPTYPSRFKCFLFMGTNKPVKITDARSGLIRRLIDVSPSGNKVSQKEYQQLMQQIPFELGAIAQHCLNVYSENPGYYDSYIPVNMLGASNDFYNFVSDSYFTFSNKQNVSLKTAWELYKNFCEEARVSYPLSQRAFKEELKNYFSDYCERYTLEDGSRVRSYYIGFKTDKFEGNDIPKTPSEEPSTWLVLDNTKSLFDEVCAGDPAQYANDDGIPLCSWSTVGTTVSQLQTDRLHYVKLSDLNHIVIDFDLKDESGNKSKKLNIEAASKWPPTYAEYSKGGNGIHLHYIYKGDVEKLSRIYDTDIEVKVFTGNSSLRRRLSKCNDIPIATISSGLPFKKEKKVVTKTQITTERSLRTMIIRNLNKEIHPNTKPSIDFIKKILDDAYESGMEYDVSDMRSKIFNFAAGSRNNAKHCIQLISKMKFKSKEELDNTEFGDEAPIAFYDVEVFPNLFLVNWKIRGSENPVIRWYNPTPEQIEKLIKYRLIGFNNRRYDNHMIYACMLGKSNQQIFELSQSIINKDPNAFFGNAYNLSYTDIYDFSSKKQSLKKFEIELGIHHQELGLPWDQPVPEDKWPQVGEYCDYDVLATEALFESPDRQADFAARIILAKLAGMTVNDTTNSLTTRIIFGKNRTPQNEFNYRDLSKPVSWDQYDEYREKMGDDYVFHIFDENGLPTFQVYNQSHGECTKLPDGWSIMPFFPGYKYENGISTYLGEEIGEGGRVFARPGMYADVWDGDVSSMHPHTIIAEMLFGKRYTKRFMELVDARVAVKHKDIELAKTLLGGVLVEFLKDDSLLKTLAQALKIAINSVYGLTAAAFENAFHDIRNRDNIVAKRGALVMTLLKQEVEKRGFMVAHIKTDSIKIPNATPEIRDFVIRFGREYGYEFETEAQFDKFCLINKAIYIAKEKGEWTAVGDQFAVPFVFKTLFSKEKIEFSDFCETKAAPASALYLDFNENSNFDPVVGKKNESKIKRLNTKLELLKSKVENGSATPKEESLLPSIKEELNAIYGYQATETHDLKFIGKVGQFCPVKPGLGGGNIMREGTRNNETVYDFAAGTSGYRWMESEALQKICDANDPDSYNQFIDKSYFDTLVNDAVETISKFGDFEWFIADDNVAA